MKRGVPTVRHSNAKVHWLIDFIRKERVRQGIPLVALSLSISPCQSTMSNYERGAASLVSLRTLERALDVLGYKLHIRKKE